MADIIARNHARIDEWQTQMLVKALRAGSIKLYAPRLKPSDHADIFVEPVASIEDAVAESVERSGDHHVAVVPEGPYVIPVYRSN
jgi:hypothetical protein